MAESRLEQRHLFGRLIDTAEEPGHLRAQPLALDLTCLHDVFGECGQTGLIM